MNYKRKIIVSAFILIVFTMFCMGCEQIIPNISPDSEPPFNPLPVGPSSGWIIIGNDMETIKDCTPILSVYSEGADYMSFSGDGENWTEWEEYSTSYEKFNIANGLNGTIFGSGTKYVYVRFKDDEGKLSPFDEISFDIIEYEMGELFSIKIFPQEITIPMGGNYLFTLHGYDCGARNEVPLDGSKVTWTKCCGGVGNLSPTTGLSTTYTAPSIPGNRDISAHYVNLSTGAVIVVIGND